MTDKKAIKVLTQMIRKYPLTKEEEEAIRVSIGVLGWTKLVESWRENRHKQRENSKDDDL